MTEIAFSAHNRSYSGNEISVIMKRTDTHFFKSKTEMRLPTGLMTEFPSLEKHRFPWR